MGAKKLYIIQSREKQVDCRRIDVRYASACSSREGDFLARVSDKLKHIEHLYAAIYLFLPALYNIKFFGTYKLYAVLVRVCSELVAQDLQFL